MNTRLVALTLVAAVLMPFAASASSPASRLTLVLSCKSNASPAKVAGLIRELDGHTLMSESALTDVEYTLPTPINVFGQPVTQISVHPGNNTDGDFTEYRSRFSAPAATVARYAGITPDQGTYKRQDGNNDVILRFEPGGSYIVCAQGVRSVPKWIKREYRAIRERTGG